MFTKVMKDMQQFEIAMDLVNAKSAGRIHSILYMFIFAKHTFLTLNYSYTNGFG